MKLAILGTGGHADAVQAAWGGKRVLPRFKYPDGLTPETHRFHIIVGVGGVDVDYLERRYHTIFRMEAYYVLHNMISFRSVFAPPRDRNIGSGIVVMPMASVGPNARIENFAIINTGAIVEHDAFIGAGTHVAPGAVVAGGAKIGRWCFIGANAVVPQGAIVPDGTFIKAGDVFKGKPK